MLTRASSLLAALAGLASVASVASVASAQSTRLLRQPTLSATQVAFEYGADLWVVGKDGGPARRLTSTPAVESEPHFSPDGRWIAFTSTRSGGPAVFVVSADGGDARRLTWSPAGERARGWTPDGKHVLFSSGRVSAPTTYAKLFTIPVDGGPARQLPAYMGLRGSFSPNGEQVVVDRVDRWDVEFRSYRGGQNTPLVVMNVATGAESKLPNERTMDIDPVWLGETIYFLSDRDWATNVWSYDTRTRALTQLTRFKDADVKALGGHGATLVFEQDGWLWTMPTAGGAPRKLDVSARGDFPWAMPRFTDVTRTIASASLGPNGRRAVFESRGEIFTVPVEKGDARNLTRSAGAADRAPVWAPDGRRVAWFSDEGAGYRLTIADADGLTPPRTLGIDDAKFAWKPAWSPDGARIAFVDDKVRLRVIDVATGRMTTADTGGAANDRGAMRPQWSPDSRWLAYAKTFANQFQRVVVWSAADGGRHTLTDALASATEPVWDRNGKWLYFLASTDLGVGSGWADLGNVVRGSTNGVYVALLRNDEPTPFTPESDEEAAARMIGTPPGTPSPGSPGPGAPRPGAPGTPGTPGTPGDSARGGGAGGAPRVAAPLDTTRRGSDTTRARATPVRIDFDRIDRRILALPMPVRDYATLLPGPAGTLFVAERVPNQPGTTLHKWDMAKRAATVFVTGVSRVSASADGKKLLWQPGHSWVVVGADAPPRAGDGALRVSLETAARPDGRMAADLRRGVAHRARLLLRSEPRTARTGPRCSARYAPLVPHRAAPRRPDVRARPGRRRARRGAFVRARRRHARPTDSSRVGALGADLVADGERWRIARIYTSESWNPGLRAPLDAPGVKARVGDYLLEVNGVAGHDARRAVEGARRHRRAADRAAARPSAPTASGAWTVTVIPVRTEAQLRQRAWIEDNRRRVDSLSRGTLAYVWVPNTSQPAITAFDRYYFAQQDRQGAVIDERFNGGGLLDDYMVGIMSRKPVGGVTTTCLARRRLRLPAAGIWGPKVLVTNELAGSGGDYFPWVFPQLKVGPLIGTRTWGGLVNASVPYPLVDGGTITAPAHAVFGPNGEFIAEGEGVPPDIEVLQDVAAPWRGARSAARARRAGGDEAGRGESGRRPEDASLRAHPLRGARAEAEPRGDGFASDGRVRHGHHQVSTHARARSWIVLVAVTAVLPDVSQGQRLAGGSSRPIRVGINGGAASRSDSVRSTASSRDASRTSTRSRRRSGI